MGGLKQFILSVRQSKNNSDEAYKVRDELRHVFKQLKVLSSDREEICKTNYYRRKSICKLIYIKLAGYELNVKNENGVGFEISSEELTKVGIEQCLILLQTKYSMYVSVNNEKRDSMDHNIKELNQDREIGFLGLKSVFSDSVSIRDWEVIITSILGDIDSINTVKSAEATNSTAHLISAYSTLISMDIQSVGDLLLSMKGNVVKEPFMDNFFNALFELLDDHRSQQVSESIKIRIIMCIGQFLKLDSNNNNSLKSKLLTRENLAFMGRLFAQVSLKESSAIIALCSLFEKWVVYDWQGVKSIEGLIITKLNEIVEITKTIGFENDKNGGESIENYDWILKYGHMLISVLNLLSSLTSVSGNLLNSGLKLTIDNIISNSVGIRAKLFRNTERHSKYQLINANILFASLELYINDINADGITDKSDTGSVIASIVTFLKFNDNINIKILCLEKLLFVLERSADLGYARRVIFDESKMWKKFIHDKNPMVSMLISKIVVLVLDPDIVADDKVTFHDIKDAVILLLYYLQNCDYTRRGCNVSNILTILENYRDSGIIQEAARKMLKIFITIGSFGETLWERVYKLVIYAMEAGERESSMISLVIDFVSKGLSINCSENFIRLGSLIFQYNCSHMKYGDLNSQLALLMEKYESANVLAKLSILDTMNVYYRCVSDANLKRVIMLAFEQEGGNANTEIKQRSHEYWTVNQLQVDLKWEEPLDMAQLASFEGLGRPAEPGGDWGDGYVRCLKFDQGILHNDDAIRVIYRIKRERQVCFIDLSYKLKGGCSDGFTCGLKTGSNEYYDLDVCENRGVVDPEAHSGSLVLRYSIKGLYGQHDEPAVFFALAPRKTLVLTLALGLKSLHPSVGSRMLPESFQARWNSIGHLLKDNGGYSCSAPLHLPEGRGNDYLAELVARYMTKMGFEVVSSLLLDAGAAFQLSCAGIVTTSTGSIGILVMVKNNNVELRCTSVTGAKFLCDRIILALEK